MIAWILAVGAAIAGGGAGASAEAGAALDAVTKGDAAWWAGHRAQARRAWRTALRRADDSPAGHAAEAMARVRLLQLGGNLAPFVHEGPLRRALEACPASEPWCAIAEADADLFLPAFTGADPARVPGEVGGSPLAGPASARIAVATGDRAALDALPESALDGMGTGIRATGRLRPAAPGTWVLGLAVGGAPGAGVGINLRYLDPDLASRAHRLEVVAGADTRGGFAASASLLTATHPSAFATAGAGRTVGDYWGDAGSSTYSLTTLRASAGVAPAWSAVRLTLGAAARSDAVVGLPAEGGFVAGPIAGVSLGDPADDYARASVEVNAGAYTHVGLGAEWRAHPPLAGGTFAVRTLVTHVPTDSPFYRLPTAGGTEILRGLPAGRFRGDTLIAAQAEYRHPLVGPLSGAAFLDTAWIEGPHLTGGVGVRLSLPPERYNVTRLDVGFGPEGWGVVAAWGEVF